MADTRTPAARTAARKLLAEADRIIARAARHEITLTRGDFTVSEGDLYLDGMDPKEWIDAMIMD
jgi:hypothetical protein